MKKKVESKKRNTTAINCTNRKRIAMTKSFPCQVVANVGFRFQPEYLRSTLVKFEFAAIFSMTFDKFECGLLLSVMFILLS